MLFLLDEVSASSFFIFQKHVTNWRIKKVICPNVRLKKYELPLHKTDGLKRSRTRLEPNKQRINQIPNSIRRKQKARLIIYWILAKACDYCNYSSVRLMQNLPIYKARFTKQYFVFCSWLTNSIDNKAEFLPFQSLSLCFENFFVVQGKLLGG